MVTLQISCMFAALLVCCSSSDAASVKPCAVSRAAMQAVASGSMLPSLMVVATCCTAMGQDEELSTQRKVHLVRASERNATVTNMQYTAGGINVADAKGTIGEPAGKTQKAKTELRSSRCGDGQVRPSSETTGCNAAKEHALCVTGKAVEGSVSLDCHDVITCESCGSANRCWSVAIVAVSPEATLSCHWI